MKFLKRNKSRRPTTSNEETTPSTSAQQQPATRAGPASLGRSQDQPSRVQNVLCGNSNFTANGATFNMGDTTNINAVDPTELKDMVATTMRAGFREYEDRRDRHHSPPSPQRNTPPRQQPTSYSTNPNHFSYGTGAPPNFPAFNPSIFASPEKLQEYVYGTYGLPAPRTVDPNIFRSPERLMEYVYGTYGLPAPKIVDPNIFRSPERLMEFYRTYGLPTPETPQYPRSSSSSPYGRYS